MTSAAGPRPRATGDQQRSAGGKVADVFVVFGITGDLAKVMTFRSLTGSSDAGLVFRRAGRFRRSLGRW